MARTSRTYKRDSRGRFAGGGGGAGPSGGGGKKSAGAKKGGGLVQRQKAKLAAQRQTAAQTQRAKAFSSKAQKGRAAKEIWKQDSRAVRSAQKMFDRARAPGSGIPKVGRENAGRYLADKKGQLYKTQLMLQGRYKELKGVAASDRQMAKQKMKRQAERAVEKGRAKASKTLKGKAAAVKRFLTGSKRRRR